MYVCMCSLETLWRPSWSWSYGSWIYNYLCNQCLSPLMLWVRTPFMAKSTRYNIMWLRLSVTCDRSVVFSTNKTYRYDITEILLNVALNTINQPGNNMASSVDSISLSIYFVLKSILKTISELFQSENCNINLIALYQSICTV